MLNLFDRCHHRRRKVVGSITGWTSSYHNDEDMSTNDAFINIGNSTQHEVVSRDIDNLLLYDPDTLDDLHLHSTSVKPMSKKVLNTMCHNILHNYKKLPLSTQLAISSTLISIEQLATHGNGNEKILTEDTMESPVIVMEHMKDIVQNYASAFNSTSLHMTLADRNASLTTKSATTTLKR